jgi:hypothetical protein
MELTVKAIGYGWIYRTNSADVKNIAYDEQSDCLFAAYGHWIGNAK